MTQQFHSQVCFQHLCTQQLVLMAHSSIFPNRMNSVGGNPYVHQWTDEQNMLHPYNGLLFSDKRNEAPIHTVTWTDLDNIRLIERSQAQESRERMIPSTCKSR